jgi:ABC-type polysaccharide/polyol phosphate transport system ATPase subunit
MQTDPHTLVRLEDVGRVYPRDVADMPSAVIREMLRPLRSLAQCPPRHFHALRGVDLSIATGERCGVLGAHRSGKSTLAGVVAGLLRPTTGTVTSSARRNLVARPGAGFKPGLSVLENLSLRAILHGMTGDELAAIVDRTLQSCGMSVQQARTGVGNLSPMVVKRLAITLLIELPADLVVVDEVTGGGTGEARWEMRARIQDKVQAVAAMVVTADTSFVRDTVERAWVLHQGRLYGPFPVEEAIEAFSELPPELAAEAPGQGAFDPMRPPRAAQGAVSMSPVGEDDGDLEGRAEDESEAAVTEDQPMRGKPPTAPLRPALIRVDGEEFRHARFSLIRPPGSMMRIELELACLMDHEFTGGMFSLHGGNSGTEVGRLAYPHETVPLRAGEKVRFSFEFVVPDWDEDFYGLSFCPQTRGKHFAPEHRLKLLIYGVGRKHEGRKDRVLDIRNGSFERTPDHASIDPLSRPAQGQHATGEVGAEVRPAA